MVWVHCRSNAFDKAAALYLKCLEADPGCIKARRNLVQTYLQLRNWDKVSSDPFPWLLRKFGLLQPFAECTAVSKAALLSVGTCRGIRRIKASCPTNLRYHRNLVIWHS
jgi:hypothetical protein